MRPYHWFLIAAAVNALVTALAYAVNGYSPLFLFNGFIFLVALVCAWVTRRAE